MGEKQVKKLLGIGAVVVLLNGCAFLGSVDKVVDDARDKYCAAPGQRAIVKAALDPEARADDWALCIRCEGETQLSCVGDPMTLPAVVN
jgi:hypothetical protein